MAGTAEASVLAARTAEASVLGVASVAESVGIEREQTAQKQADAGWLQVEIVELGQGQQGVVKMDVKQGR